MTSRFRKRAVASIAVCVALASMGVIGSGVASARSTRAVANCPGANTVLLPRSAFPADNGGTVNYVRNQLAVRDAVLCLLNGERDAHGIPRLTRYLTLRGAAPGLGGAAAQHAREAISHRWWLDPSDWPAGTVIPSTHNNPYTGSTPATRIAAAGYCRAPYTYLKVAEITYAGTGPGSTPAAARHWWMEVSTGGHRDIILDRQLTDIGIAAVVGNAHVGHESDTPAVTYVVTFGTCTR
jgi:uncharacterized protein YkwD